MKNKTPLYTAIGLCLVIVAIIASCSLMGCANTTPPNKVEQVLFSTVTNVVTVTNQVPVPVQVYRTNEVVLYSTNQLNQTVVTYSNVVNVAWQTNNIAVQAFETNYIQTPKPDVTAAAGGVGGIINTFLPSVGSLVTEGVLGVLAGWAAWRSRKKGATAETLAQEIETVRSFIRALPNGTAYDTELVNFLQAHQNEAGVAQEVLKILADSVSNPDAKVAAQTVIDAINALKSVTTPVAPAA